MNLLGKEYRLAFFRGGKFCLGMLAGQFEFCAF